MLMFCLFCNLFGGVLVGSLLLGNVGVSPILIDEVQSINQSIIRFIFVILGIKESA
jgi:hypothetical protein